MASDLYIQKRSVLINCESVSIATNSIATLHLNGILCVNKLHLTFINPALILNMNKFNIFHFYTQRWKVQLKKCDGLWARLPKISFYDNYDLLEFTDNSFYYYRKC